MTTILITGASRGIGRAAAVALARRGCTVYAGARRPASVEQPAGLDLRPIALDVTDDMSVAAAAREIASLDVLINNAGVPGSFGDPSEIGPEDFAEVLATNLLGPVRVTRAFLPLLRRSPSPRLVMVSSGMGSLTLQSEDPAYAEIAHLPYPASKAALNMLTVQYAKALPDVRVTAVDPGLTATEFTAHSGHSVEEGAAPIVAAALDTRGPTGCFIGTSGPEPW